MGKTITLSDPYITSLFIDPVEDIVRLSWRIDLPDGRQYRIGDFVFYRDAPTDKIVDWETNGDPIYGTPDTWNELNSTAKSAVTTLVNLATTFLGNQDL